MASVLKCHSTVVFLDTDCDSNLPNAEKVGIIDVSQENPYLNIDVAAIQWPQGKKAPRDSPQCGFDGENCPSTSTGSTATNGPSRFGWFEEFAGLCVCLFVCWFNCNECLILSSTLVLLNWREVVRKLGQNTIPISGTIPMAQFINQNREKNNIFTKSYIRKVFLK